LLSLVKATRILDLSSDATSGGIGIKLRSWKKRQVVKIAAMGDLGRNVVCGKVPITWRK
jgi:hypothetical protein